MQGSPCFLMIVYPLNEHKVNIGAIGERVWPATNPEIQDRDTHTVSMRKEKIRVKSMEIEV